MDIVEINLAAKTGQLADCEDRYCVTEHYACVIDGATDVSGKRYDGRTSGQVIASLLEEGVRLLPPEAALEEAVRRLNEGVLQAYKQRGIYESVTENAHSLPSAAMVIFSRHLRQVWMIGDCQCMLDGLLYTNEKDVDNVTAQARALFLEAELMRGKTIEQLMENDTGFAAILPFLQAQYELQNAKSDSEFSYIGMTGFPFDLDQVKVVNVPQHVRSLVLASDGYPRLRDSLEESEAELRFILDHDPLCFREYKLAKGVKKGCVSFDDRTYIKLEL
ncbi:hypothetical protein [Paenibacillus senegalensis]|uniref:hypothetical protein n=1 Tax=Paenibacillus senegalensis TaxID=1465766 RepID=UPI000289C19C|nr:hypothetical protein [Paenibacillus senegalensis]